MTPRASAGQPASMMISASRNPVSGHWGGGLRVAVAGTLDSAVARQVMRLPYNRTTIRAKSVASNRNLIERREAIVPKAVGQFAGQLTAVSASGARVTDADGHEFIDFAGGIGVMNVGHSAPEVVRAIQDQAERLIHVSIHVATYEPYVELCEKLADLLPHGESTKVILINSGAEAVENAIKLARQATGRPAVICFSEAFHGRTLMALALTSKTKYKTWLRSAGSRSLPPALSQSIQVW